RSLRPNTRMYRPVELAHRLLLKGLDPMKSALTRFARCWSRLRRWSVASAAAVVVVLSTTPLRAQGDEGKKAKEGDGSRWIRVVEEQDGQIVRLQLVSREYRREDGSGPSVFLTGAVHV